MLTVQSSSNLFVTATHILVIRVDSADPKPWADYPPAGEERTVSLVLTLEEVVKGKVRQKPGDSIKLDATQVRYTVDWRPPPGVWSRAAMDSGTRLVAFSKTHSDDAAQVLNDPAGMWFLPVAEALLDVHLAARAEASHLDLAGILAQAKAVAPSLGAVFGDYLWDHYASVAMADIRQFDLVASFLEEPALNNVVRTLLIIRVPDSVRAPEPPARAHIDRLAIAFFRILALPEAQAFHDDIVATDLPNLLDVANKDARPPSEVFRNYPGERVRAQRALAKYKGPESPAPLLGWLAR